MTSLQLLENGGEVIPPELLLFQDPPLNAAFQKIQYVEYRPTSQLNVGGPLQFVIQPTASQYINLARTRLHVKVKIVKGDGTVPGERDFVGPVNLTLHSLFSQADVRLQQTLVSSTASQTYGYKSYLQTLLQHGTGAKESFLQTQGYFKDTAGFMDSADVTQGNVGLAERYSLFRGGRIVDLEGPIMADICQQNRLILNGVEVHIRLWPAKDEFCLVTAVENPDYKIEFVEAYLRVCKATPVDSIILAHAEALRIKPAVYPFTKSELKAFQLNQGQFSFHIEDIFQSNIPSEVVVGMVNATSFIGSYTTNPYNFIHHHINSLALYVDDESVPGKPLEMNFDVKNYLTAYQALFDDDEEEELAIGNDIQRQEYDRGYTLFKFRVKPDHLSPFLPTITKGNVKISGNFGRALPENVTLLILGRFPSVITIDATRSINI